jgi:hypothetical protein
MRSLIVILVLLAAGFLVFGSAGAVSHRGYSDSPFAGISPISLEASAAASQR